MKAMVLAAGVGSRLDPLTSQLPKPLVPIANRPVLELILRLLKKHGCQDVVSNLHYLPDKIRNYFGDGSSLGINLDFRYEATLSGDAGGVRACRDFFGQDTFIVLMGDLLTDADLSRIYAEHKRKGALATIGITRVEDVSQFGVVVRDSEGFIKGFQEKPAPEEALSDFASTGIYVLEPEVFDYIPATGSFGFGRQLFPLLVEQGLPLLSVDLQSYWSDVGTVHQYKQSNFDALEGALKIEPALVRQELGYLAPGSKIEPGVVVNGTLMLGRRSKLGSGARIKGRVIIGENCRIERNAFLEDTIVWSNSVVEENASLSNCIVGSGCVVQNGSKHRQVTAVKWPVQTVKV
jgi:mannose-1-phosphate guanylyltransferase